MNSSDAAAIITGTATVIVAIAGFISTAWQAGRAQRAAEKSARHTEKKDLYVRMMRALSVALDARSDLIQGMDSGITDEEAGPLKDRLSKSIDEASLLITEMMLLAPSQVTGLTMRAVIELSEPNIRESRALSGAQFAMATDIQGLGSRRFRRKQDFFSLVDSMERAEQQLGMMAKSTEEHE